MNICLFDTHSFEKDAFTAANKNTGHSLTFFDTRLNSETAKLAAGFKGVCSFVNDKVDGATLETLKEGGTKLLLLRSAGYNHVDLVAAKNHGITVMRVPEYSPYAVAEHAVALILSMNRKIHRAYNRVRESNFALDGFVGFDLHGKTVGVIGTGRIGRAFANIMSGFGCTILAYDKLVDHSLKQQIDIQYVSLEDLFSSSDILSLHIPLTPETKHIINDKAFSLMKKGAMLINTSRGGLIDTTALIRALKGRTLGYAGLDVYEEEEGVFFEDLSSVGLDDDILARLLTFPNVLITSHQGFLTREALSNIAETTLSNACSFERGERLENEVCAS
jgi:D-lactate dehydrogenase